MKAFRKVLVANRGEIAVRITRTLHEMGIAAVAVYSEADRGALHVRMADEAYPIGAAPAAESYLRVDAIVDVAKKSGSDAIHPGYGFLSENPSLPDACERAGVVFIGPPASAMRSMGSKTAARDKMQEAGVPVVPGARCTTRDDAAAAAVALGYPVMLKAAAGGGGKGMRLVAEPAELPSAWDRARSEAKKFFGDDDVYLEKAIIRPRHVEIQVLGDRDGRMLHVFERDCSIQRRHQKVVEEAPGPAVSRELAARMGAIAVRGAASVGYFSAGTFEFLLAEDGSFYFLEMNTRLQVEHPVTELVTGLDLVREMVRIAQGEPLGFAQEDLTLRGAAIECRVYAEESVDRISTFARSHRHADCSRRPGSPRRRGRVPRLHDIEPLRSAHLQGQRLGADSRIRHRPNEARTVRVRRDGHPHEPRLPPTGDGTSSVRRWALRHRIHRAVSRRPARASGARSRATRGAFGRDRSRLGTQRKRAHCRRRCASGRAAYGGIAVVALGCAPPQPPRSAVSHPGEGLDLVC